MAEGGLNAIEDTSSDTTDKNEDVIVAFPPSNNKSSDSKTSVHIKLSTAISLSKIGEAAVKGNFDVEIYL